MIASILNFLTHWGHAFAISYVVWTMVKREWNRFGATAESAKAALKLPLDDPSRPHIARKLWAEQLRAIWMIRIIALVWMALIFITALYWR